MSKIVAQQRDTLFAIACNQQRVALDANSMPKTAGKPIERYSFPSLNYTIAKRR